MDGSIGYCTETVREGSASITNAFGPFEQGLVGKCLSAGGGTACYLNRWDARFVTALVNR